jgi:hypothetical protein
MPNITLKGVPVKVYRELKRRAAAGRRSLNSEAILRLEESLARPGDAAADPEAFVTGLKAFRERLNAAAWSDADITRAKRAGRP